MLFIVVVLLVVYGRAIAAPDLADVYRSHRGVVRCLPNWMPAGTFPACAPWIRSYLERRYPGLTVYVDVSARQMYVTVGLSSCELELRDWSSYPGLAAYPLCLIAHQRLRSTVALAGGAR